MNPLLSAMSRYVRRPHTHNRKARRRSLHVERLEDRTVPTAVAAPSNLVSWWKAQNTGSDQMGLNNATLYNGTTYAAGEVGQAFSFDGVNDLAQVTDSDSLKFTTSFTIEGWIKVNGYPSGPPYDHGEIFFRGDDRGGLDPYYLATEPDGTLNFGITNASNQGTSIRAPVSLGQFIHVAATLDDATGIMRLYENGAVVAEQVTTIRPFRDLDPASNPAIGIGNHGGAPNMAHDFPFNGLIDELTVYNRALTPGEVLGIYKAGSDGKVLSPIAVDFPSVVEGATGTTTPVTFTITRTGSLSGSLTVNWTTADDTATAANSDYVAASGTVIFADGEATKTVQVTVNGDNTVEPDETFKLVVTPVGGTAIMGIATIVNDDIGISISNASATEGSNALKILDRFVATGSGGLARPRGSTFGPDGNNDEVQDLYVTSADTNGVLRFDGVTGSFIDTFVSSASGGLNSPVDLAFGSDGKLYVTSYGSNQLLRYDGTSGAFLDVVSSSLSSPEGITLGPDGNLYIANLGTNEVLRYTNAGLSVFVSAGSGTLSKPRKVAFGPDVNGDLVQDLYVTSEGNSKVLRFDGVTGASTDTIVNTGTALGAMWVEIGADGYLYVVAPTTASSGGNKSIFRYNATTGALVDSLALGRDGWAFHIGPGNYIYDSGTSAGAFVDRIGPSSLAAFTVSLNTASATSVTVNYATADGTALAGSDYTAASGTLTFAPGETTKAIIIATVDNTTIELAESFTVSLSSAVGGTITSGQGTGTILDNDTKFYVLNDAATDKTYEYAVDGTAGESYNLGSGDTAPRGAAANAAGTNIWVVDSNKTVYVYNPSGTLLGSWSATGLNSNAQVEGIATNGTDIWLLDNFKDKVYKYTGAASRLSGSQSAASNFDLSSSNSSGKGIVTDGTYLWVVNDSSTDKVFKYTVSGTSKGSWTIDAANSSPTGLTVNPNNVSDIWIVDSGTKKAYQYTNAAGKTSGSQNAAASFALAAGNTNPQDIADPTPFSTTSVSLQQVESRAAASIQHGDSSGLSGERFASVDAVWLVDAETSAAGRDRLGSSAVMSSGYLVASSREQERDSIVASLAMPAGEVGEALGFNVAARVRRNETAADWIFAHSGHGQTANEPDGWWMAALLG